MQTFNSPRFSRRQYAWLPFFLTCFVSCVAATESLQETFLQSGQINEKSRILQNWQSPVYEVEVLASNQNGTVANPPTSRGRVLRTLRGPPRNGEFTFVWTLGHSSIENVNPDCNVYPAKADVKCDRSAMQLSEKALSQVQLGPETNRRLIVQAAANWAVWEKHPGAIPLVQQLLKQPNTIAANTYYLSDPKSMDAFSEHALYEERFARRHMGILFALVLASMSATAFIALIIKNPVPSVLMGVASFAAYLFYETGIDIHENIRVDMIFILPAMCVAAIAVIVRCVRSEVGRIARGSDS